MNSRIVAAMICFPKNNRRTAALSVLLVIVLAPISRVDATDKLDKAIQRIESLGGEIKRDEKLPGHPVTEITLRGYFDPNAQSLFDENAHLFRVFPNLTTLNLGGANITDAGWKELGEFKNLTTLSLTVTEITDTALKELSGLKNLTTLYVFPITDVGLKELGRLQNLTSLYLGGVGITPTGLKEFGSPKRVPSPNDRRPNLTDTGIMELKKTLPSLQVYR